MTYRDGFDAGEHQAFIDRQRGVVQHLAEPQTEEQRGYHDGYYPRSSEWTARPPARPQFAEVLPVTVADLMEQ